MIAGLVVGAAAQPVAESCKVLSGCGFPSPGTESFEFSPIFTIFGWGVTKPVLYMVIGTLIVAVAVLAAFARPKLVPTGWQNAMEVFYDFIRIDIVASVIGKKGSKWGPYLATLFLFIFFMNFLEIVPGIQFPITSKIAYPMTLTIMTWLIFNYIGIRRQGFVGYFKNMMFPPGLPKWIYFLLAPIEFFSTIIVRPFTLAVRLFANMFAGHILLMIFSLGATYLLVAGVQSLFAAASFVMAFIMTGFELFIELLQAYIFVLLTASYIGGAMEAEH